MVRQGLQAEYVMVVQGPTANVTNWLILDGRDRSNLFDDAGCSGDNGI